jgi:hypothetical protein
MSINWSHLPPDVISKICMCIGKDQKDGYGYDEATGYWVHRVYRSRYGDKPGCDKPSVLACVVECEECEQPFVPEKQKTVKFANMGLGAVCPPCEEKL